MEFRRHAGTRFDGDDPGPALVEEASGDARAVADIDGAGAPEGAAGQFLDGIEECGRVAGAGRGVLGGRAVEGEGAGRGGG
ncbi:hypothetical protein GCM10015535_48370 [Streptomyces gelaticus]|uniref:Uncharacterized protein n=1 Tax=Streptomyces gelaticus TaxID=285446 RepID=A0ABQ2W3B8_9ACTN|nr:hypothetical protein GCM10015535_48370 [Streptomyces gelaticus]